MSLNFLYRRNADLCSEMAAKTQSVEVREQWLELAKGWVAKAESEERTLAAARHRPPMQLTRAAKPSPEIEIVQELDPAPVWHRQFAELIAPLKLVRSQIETGLMSERNTNGPAKHRPPMKAIELSKLVLPEIKRPQEGRNYVPEEPAPALLATEEPSIKAPQQPQKQDVEPLDETWATLMAEIRGR